MTYDYKKYEFTAFTEADFLGQGGNGSSIGCGDTFTMPGAATVCLSTWDNDSSLSGDSYCNENSNDGSGQKAIVDGARVGSQMYAESYHVLRGSDGKTYYMIEIEVEGYNAPGAGDDFFTFYGPVPPAGVSLTVTQTCNVKGNWVDFACIGAGEKAPVNEAPTFTNVPADGIICVDENQTFVIDLAASDADGDTLTYEIVGGADAGAFTIDATTGELTFTAGPDYEAPTDGNGNNVYDVTVKVSDGKGGEEIKPLWIKVKDVEEGTGGTCIVVEAEDMQLCGYRVQNEDDASGGQVIKGSVGCWSSAKTTFDGPAGEYDLKLYVLDENDGQGRICVNVNGQWVLDVRLDQDNGGSGYNDTATFRELVIEDLNLQPGDVVTVWGLGQGGEYARVDRLEFCGEKTDPMTAELGDRVWFDTDKDGQQDAGEQGAANVTVLLKDAAGNTIDQTTTDANGDYLFTGLAAGDYKVCVVAPGSYVFTSQNVGNDASDSDVMANGMSDMVTLAEGESNLTVDAGLVDPGTAEISGRYFCDENNNDVDDAEPAIAGATVELLNATGAVIATTTTDANGDYAFTGLDAGDYSVRFAADTTGKTFVGQNAGNDDAIDSDVDNTGTTGTISVGIGEVSTDNDAGVEDPGTASLAGRVFCDDNNNDVDDAEQGVGGVAVTLLTAAGAIVATGTTAADGSYSFTGLDAGDYKVMFDESTAGGKALVAQNAGSDDTVDSDADANGMTGVYTVNIGDNVTDVDAGVEDPGTASLAGRVFCDDNNNDVDDAEQGVGGVAVTLLTAAGAIVATGTTAADGSYSFTGLDAGDYKVMFDESTAGGKALVAQNAGSDDTVDSDADANGMTGVYTVNIGDNVTDVDAGVEVLNTDPTPTADMGKVCVDDGGTFNVLSNDADADGDVLSVLSIADADEIVFVGETLTLASGSTATLNADGTITYDGTTGSNAGLLVGSEAAEEQITYTVTDGNGGTGTSTLDITACGSTSTLQMICDALPAQIQLNIALTGTPLDYQITVADDASTTADDGLASAIWGGFCIDINGQLLLDTDLTVNVYGTCDPIPDGLIANPENLDNIEWLINQDFMSQTNVNGELYDVFDLQEAVWVLSDGTTSTNADANVIAQAALANGDGFVAQEGDLVAVIFDPISPDPTLIPDTQSFIMGVNWDALELDCIC